MGYLDFKDVTDVNFEAKFVLEDDWHIEGQRFVKVGYGSRAHQLPTLRVLDEELSTFFTFGPSADADLALSFVSSFIYCPS